MLKPKILMMLSRSPYPAVDGTRYKILHNVSEVLIRDFTIEYCIVTFFKVNREDIDFLEKTYGKVHLFKISLASFIIHSLLGVLKGLPFQVGGFFVGSARKFVNNSITDYDAIYVHTIRMAEYFRKFPETIRNRVLIEFNDALSINYENAKRFTRFPKSAFFRMEEHLVRKYEKCMLQEFSFFNVISPYDRRYLLDMVSGVNENHFVCIPQGIEIPKIPQDQIKKPNSLYFIGRLDYDPNKDALCFFLDTMWDLIKKKLPDATLTIIGKGNMDAYKKYVGWEGVTFLGYVHDPFTVISESVLLVAPIRYGAGMPSKIIEGMAHAVPVITTPLGARGIIGLEDKRNIFIVDEYDTERWVSLIQQLCTDAVLANTIGAEAERLMQSTFSLSHVQNSWNSIFHTIVDKNKKQS